MQSRLARFCTVFAMWLAISSFAVLAETGDGDKPFGDLPSSQMAEKIKELTGIQGVSPVERAILQGGFQAMYQSKLLAEQYFAATGEDRKRLAGIGNEAVARDVAYEIVKTLKLDPAHREGAPEKMDMAWLTKWLQGEYEGIFLVKPSDGKPLEQYRMVFGVAEGKRHIEKVEKDAAFDAAVYAQNIEKDQIVAWAETALKGSREGVLGHLPKGEYPYLNAPVFGRVEVDVEPLLPSSSPVAAETAVSNWKGSISLFFKPEASEFKIAERLLVEIEKKGDSITIVKCQRDEEFAEAMEEKVEVARFIVAYVNNPDRRADWLAPGGRDELPKGATISPADRQSLALEVIEKRRLSRVMGDPGEGPLFEALCPLTLEGGGRSQYRYWFLLVKPPRAKEPFLMLRSVDARPAS